MSLKTSSEYSNKNKPYIFKSVFLSKEPIVSSNIGFLSPQFNSTIYSHSLLSNNTIDYNIKKSKQSLRKFSMKDNNSTLLEKVTHSVNKKGKAQLLLKKPTESRNSKSLRNTFSHSMYSMKSRLSNSSSQNTIKSPYNRRKTKSISSSMLEETPIKPIKTKTLKRSLSTVYDSSNILRFCRNPVKNNMSNIKGRLSQNDDNTLRHFRKKLFLNQSLATIEKEGDALEQVIQHNIKKDEKYHSKISSLKEIILENKEYMELYKDFNIKLYLPNKNEKQFKDVHFTIDYLKQLNSKVAYSQRYFFAKKVGFGWDEKYQFKRKDRYKITNQQGKRPDAHLI